MTELCLAAVAVDHGVQHAERGIDAEAVAPGDVVDGLLAGGGELSHGDVVGNGAQIGLVRSLASVEEEL